MIRVAIVDDHPVTSSGVAAALIAEGDMEIVGRAGSLADIQHLVATTAPDVLLCDIQVGNDRALNVPKLLGPPPPAVLFFTAYDYPSFVRKALDAGAAGYVLKSAPLEELTSAIRQIAAGGSAWNSRHLRQARGAPTLPSARELEVVALVAAGRSNAEIGGTLGINERTVESHLRRLFNRYGVSSRTELSTWCIRNGWIDPVGADGAG